MSGITLQVKGQAFLNSAAQFAAIMKKELKDVLNRETFFICAESAKQTHKADIQKLTDELGGTLMYKAITRGKNVGKWRRAGLHLEDKSLAEKIIWARAAKGGIKPGSAQEAQSMAKRLINARRKSVAYLKSGWIPAIRAFASRIGFAPRRIDAQQVGSVAKGFGIPAIEGARPIARAANEAWTKHGDRNALEKYVLPALVQAIAISKGRLDKLMALRLRDAGRRARLPVR